MNDYATSGKETSEPTRKNLRVTVCRNGVVNVRNPNSERGHSVMLDGRGTAVRCSCKGYRFHGHCYHTGEVESRPLIVASGRAASAVNKPVATDGGTVEGEGVEGEQETCDRCPTLLADTHDEPAGYTVVTTDGEEHAVDALRNGDLSLFVAFSIVPRQ